MVFLNDPTGVIDSWPIDVSNNGHVIGRNNDPLGSGGFLWQPGVGMVPIDGSLEAISRTGAIIAGTHIESFSSEPCYWTPDGAQHLIGNLVYALGSWNGFTWGMSADGSTIVGRSMDAARDFHALRWQADTGMIDLGADFPLPSPLYYASESVALLASNEGEIVWGQNEGRWHYNLTWRWTEETGQVRVRGIRQLRSITPNGHYVLILPVTLRECVWDEVNGCRYLQHLLIKQGADLEGWGELGFSDMSADGRHFCGGGDSPRSEPGWPEAFYAVIDRPGDTPGDISGDGVVDRFDTQRFHRCMCGPGVTVEGPRRAADLDNDNDADLVDFVMLQRIVQHDPCALVGDMNLDCELTDADMEIFLTCLDDNSWYSECIHADLDQSVTIDLADVAIMQRAMGKP